MSGSIFAKVHICVAMCVYYNAKQKHPGCKKSARPRGSSIVDLIFSPVIRPGIPNYLEVLIEENLEEFIELYSSPVIPKMHYLIRIPCFLSMYIC